MERTKKEMFAKVAKQIEKRRRFRSYSSQRPFVRMHRTVPHTRTHGHSRTVSRGEQKLEISAKIR